MLKIRRRHPWKEVTMRTLPPTLAILLVAAPLLTACQTPQERAAYQAQQADEMVIVYGPACVRLGYTPHTDQWRACILNLSAKQEMQNYLSYPAFYGPGYYRGGYWGPYW
jgi:hypothetical protein